MITKAILLGILTISILPVLPLTAAPSDPPLLRGDAALTSLKAAGTYDSLQSAAAAAREEAEGTPMFSFQAKLLSPAGAMNGNFGFTVALSGETAVVGDSREAAGANANQGAAYVFIRNGTTWTQQQKLTASDGAANALFGGSVAIDGDTLVVGAGGATNPGGAQGAAYVFVRNGTVWSQQQKLTAADGASGDFFGGESVAIRGDTVAVGVPDDDNGTIRDQGSAYVFVRNGTLWTQQQKLTASDGSSDDRFGVRVAIENNTVVVGAHFDTLGPGFGHGSAYVFVRNGALWTEQQKLIASDGASNDEFGGSVAISGETVMIGAPFDTATANGQGSAYIFVRNGTTWTEQQKLVASDPATGDGLGVSVALQNNTAIAGAAYNSASTRGSAYVFSRTGATWSQVQKVIPTDGVANGGFGVSASFSGNTALIGAKSSSFNTQGSAYVYTAPASALQLTAAVSRRTHGAAGTFDVLLPLSGAPGVECRNGSGAHTLVFAFTNEVVSGSASVTAGIGSVLGSPTFSGNTMSVNLTGVANAQQITVTLQSVTDSFAQVLPNTSVNLGVLLGDTNGSGGVTSSDVSGTKAVANQTLTSANFRSDVSVNGSINASDIGQVKAASGTSIP